MGGNCCRVRPLAGLRSILAVMLLLAAGASGPVAAEQRKGLGILSEVRLGGLWHDVGVFGHSKEPGYDINMEILFVSPRLFDVVWSPRPHIGATVNTDGATSQLYGGLTWQWVFWDPFFVEGSLGLSVHDGELEPPADVTDRKSLGCRVLFRESVSLGVRIGDHHTLSGMLDHISNARLCRSNHGLETVGIRYGYRF